MSNDEPTENIETLKNEIKKQKTELEFRKDRVEKLEKELASAKSASLKHERANETIANKIKQLSTENDDLKTQVVKLNEKIKQLATEALEKELKEKKELIAKQIEEIQKLNDNITKLSNKSAEQNSKIEEQLKTLDKNKVKIESLNELLKKSENILSEKDQMISSLNLTSDKLKKGLEEAENLLLEQGHKFEENKSQIHEVMGGIKDAQSLLISKEETITQLNTTIKGQNIKLKELDLQKEKNVVKIQEIQTKISSLESDLKSKEAESKLKDEKIDEFQKKIGSIEAGIDLYQNTIKELKDELEKRKEEIRILESKRENLGDISKYEKMLATKDKTIDLLKREISDLTEKSQALESSEEGPKEDLKKESPSAETKDLTIKKIAEILGNKLSPEELNKIILTFQEKEARVQKQKAELTKLKSELKDKEKAVKLLEKNLDRSKKTVQDLQTETEIGTAITQVEKTKKTKARVDEASRLSERIEVLEQTLEEQKDENLKLQERCNLLEKTTDAKVMLEQKNAYEAYILTLQTELYDIKNQFQESESLRKEQQVHIERLETLFAQVQATIDETEKARAPDALFEKVSRISEQSQTLLGAKPSESISNIRPSELLGARISESLLGARPSESLLGARPSEPLLGQKSSESLLGAPAVSSPPMSSDSSELLGSRPLSPTETLEQMRNDSVMKIFSNLTNQFTEIKDIALVGFNGEIYFRTSPWDIKSDLFKLVQDWKAESPAVWINTLKYATIKASDSVLVATNVQGKGHILCSTIDEKLFIIINIDIQGDALLLSDDLKPVLPKIKALFEEYEKKKTQLL